MHTLVERFATCSKDCYGGCVFKGYWDDSSPTPLQKTIALKTHPFTQGVFCGKLSNRIHYLYHEDRLTNPLYTKHKNPHGLQKVSMDFAYEKISHKLTEVLNKYGGDAILGAFYSGNVGLISQYSPLRFFHSIGASITTGGICNEGGCAGLASLFGTYSTTNPLQLNSSETKLIIVWGSNLTENNNHAHLLVRKARQHGAGLIVIDSRKTKIALEADIFIPALPGTDHLIAKYILHSLSKDNSIDIDFLISHVDDYKSIISEVEILDEDFYDLLKKCTLDSIDKIDEFVIALQKNQYHTIFNIGYGVQKDLFGGQIVKTIALIQILLGNMGKPGTGIVYSQSDYNREFRNLFINEITQLKELESNFSTIHIRELGKAIINEKVKVLFVYNCNPASSLPNQKILREGLSREDLFVVVIDQFLNETTNYANFIIPAKFDIETNDFLTPYYFPSISANIAGPCPYKECVSNHEFFQRLGELMHCKMKFESDKEIYEKCSQLLPENIQNNIAIQGYYSIFGKDEIGFEDLSFPTQNTKIIGGGPHFQFKNPTTKLIFSMNFNHFLLITPNKREYLHSQLGDTTTSQRGINEYVFMNSEDCEQLGLHNDDIIHVVNQYSSGRFKVQVSEDILSRSVVLLHGLFSKDGINANFFTSDTPESMGGSGAFNSSIVEINKL